MGEENLRPLFSVIIPLYNKADTIERAIRSVWAQKYSNYELIVVDDGSSDQSLEITKKLNGEKSFTIISQANSGVSCARNKGAELAQGRFLAFLDADDLWDCDYLSELDQLVNKYNDAAIVATGFYFYIENKMYRTNYRGGADCSAFNTVALFQSYHTSSVAINRACFWEVGGFDPRHGYYEDIECFFKVEIKFPGRTYVSGRALSYHMNDAAWAITKNCENPQSPHLDIVEQVLTGRASDEVKRFAHWYALYRLAYNSRSFMVDKNKEFIHIFPNIGGKGLLHKIFISTKLASVAWFIANIIIVIRKFKYCRIVKRMKNER
jgi:glycosyltransferase involved in cell wall biosynthesis